MNFIFNDNVRILCLSCNVKKSENLSDLNKKDRNKRHSSPFIKVVKGVFFVVRVTLVPVSYLSAPSAVHSYRVPGKFIRIVRKVYSSITNKAKTYSYSIFVQQMYWLQDKIQYWSIDGEYRIYLTRHETGEKTR
jgi:hypothetical protein